MKLYTVIVDNGQSYEDYEERVWGIFDSQEKAETYGAYVVGAGRDKIREEMWSKEDFGFDEYNDWGYRVEELNLNEGLY